MIAPSSLLHGRRRDWLRGGALVALLLGLGAVGRPLAAQVRPPVRAGETELNGAGWEGRRMLAQMLWLKTHAVLHAGIEEREARPGEEKSRGAEVHVHGAHGGKRGQAVETAPGAEAGDAHEHADEHRGAYVLTIPPREEDFRGILGDLERAVKPYKDERGRLYAKKGDQTIPFYRLVTWADPHFVQGYTVGASFMSDSGKRVDEGLAFLLEGERNNPDAGEIQTELGHYYLVYRKDYARAELHLRRAIALLPVGKKVTEWEEDARFDAYRWLALTYRDWGKPKEAMEVARRGLALLGEDVSLRKILQDRGRP